MTREECVGIGAVRERREDVEMTVDLLHGTQTGRREKEREKETEREKEKEKRKRKRKRERKRKRK